MKNYLYLAAVCCISLASCSSSSSTPDNSEGATDSGGGAVNTVLTGVFLDSAVKGISYETETLSGMTNESGEFQYIEGESVTFSIGDLVFPAATAMETVTPLDMNESGTINDNLVVNTTTLLQTLDVDANPSNGIEISEQATASASAIDLTVAPSDFSQDASVLNLVANSGSLNTSLISTVDASRHFQTTLVGTGSLESLTPLDYTNILIGNTATYEGGSSYYYRPDGARFAEEGGEIIETSWELDGSGAMCEVTTRGDTFCIADATGLMLTTGPSSNAYNYSDTEFTSTFTVAAGDTLGLSSDAPSQ